MARTDRATTIEINGRTYDAITGELVAKSSPVKISPKPKSTGHFIDGVVRRKPAHHQPADRTPTAKRQPAPARSVHSAPKRSATLHRQTVVRAQHQAHPHQRHLEAPDAKPSESIIGHERAQRIKQVKRSGVISKFAPDLGSPSQPLPDLTKPAPVTEPSATPTHSLAPALSPKEQLIAKHLAQVAATTHHTGRQPLRTRAKTWLGQSRNSTILASSAVAAILIGYVTYLNIPNMALRVAASRAGFEAQLPGYQPSGFRFSGPIAYREGEITVQYSSNTDSRQYLITEKESNWDSQTLLDSHVKNETQLYSTYQESGLIVYIYSGSVATWVNGGVWYSVSGNAGLTTEQLLKIAASL